MEPLRPPVYVVTEGMTRRMVIDGGCVWVEENHGTQRVLRVVVLLVMGLPAMIAFAPALVLAAIDGGAPLAQTLAGRLPLLLPLGLFVAACEHLRRTSLRAHPEIAPTPSGAWRRIACADPSQRWFWHAPERGVSLASVKVSIVRTFGFVQLGRPLRWSFELSWPGNNRLRIRLAADEELGFLRPQHAPASLQRAVQLLQQWGFSG